MGHRINVMIDDEIWGLLEKIPSGARSRAINEAVKEWAQRRQRRAAVAELKALRGALGEVRTSDIVNWIREDRARGHR